MTDVRTLLRSASPPPMPTPGINLVLDAARERQRRRRFWVWTTGVVVLGLGGPATGVLVNASHSPTRVETARPVPDRVDTPRTTAIDVWGRSPSAPSAPSVRATKQVARTDNGAASGSQSESSRTATSEGCREDRRSSSNVQLSDGGQGGAGWDAYPSCSYTATIPGGYVAKGSWRVEISRSGALFTIESARAPDCGTNVIQPGDIVTVHLRKGVNSPSDWFIEVGSNKGC